ncbi:hypothetical protein OICFNHDK_3783 [Methylobacterium bullatum]|uniref:Sialate O-acetylesterase domain-containing protein n=1 Tax=Methylobacterium bullatum TaxID=570505 RepID=A0AAV4ZBF2_9HYPH|nr:hypothetical protein OICFNHDK_3783 [Methylobacterium bullatum]
MAPPKVAAQVWRDLSDPLNPLLGAYRPEKAEIRVWAGWVESSFTSAEGRLTTLETLANIPNGSTLVADVAAAKALTRVSSSYRPADVLASWTANTTLSASAAPLIVGGNYSLVTGADGQVLQIAGGATYGVGPIYADEIVAGEVYDYIFPIQRMVDGSNAALLGRLSVFDAADVNLGQLTILSRSPTVADGFKREVVRVLANTVLAAFPTAVRAKPYLSAGSTNGTMRISMIRRKTIEGALPNQDYNHDNVTGESTPAPAMNQIAVKFALGQSLTGGVNNNSSDPIISATPRWPGLALTVEPKTLPNSGPRLRTTPSDTIVDLVERVEGSGRETPLSGWANHYLDAIEPFTTPQFTMAVSGGTVVSATLKRRYFGFDGLPTITIDNTGTGGTGVVIRPVVSSVETGGELTLQVDDGGSGYTTAPKGSVSAIKWGTSLPKSIYFTSFLLGAKYLQLKKGSVRQDWIDNALRGAKAAAAAIGASIVNPCWLLMVGNSESVAGLDHTANDMVAQVLQIQRDRADATKAITGQTLEPVMIIDPAPTNHPDFDQWNQPYVRAMQRLATYPNIRITGGTYHYPASDASHKTNAGYNRLGQQVSRVDHAESNQCGWTHLHPIFERSRRTSPTTLEIEFAMPPPPRPLMAHPKLVIDLSDAEVKLDGIQGYAGMALRSVREGRVLPISSMVVAPNGRKLIITHGLSNVAVTAANVSAPGNLFNVSPRIGWETGALVRISNSGGTLPGGLSAGTDYYVVRTATAQIKLATSLASALAGTVVTLSSAGTGTHTLTADGTLLGDGAIQAVYATKRNDGNTNDDGPVLGQRGCLHDDLYAPNLEDGYLSCNWCVSFDGIVVA